jgi:hypothetical protein
MVAVERELTETLPAVAAPVTADAIPLVLRRRGASVRQVLAMTVVGIFALALFASRDLPSWVRGIGDERVVEWAETGAVKWDDAMESLGLVRPHEALRAWVSWALELKWSRDPR